MSSLRHNIILSLFLLGSATTTAFLTPHHQQQQRTSRTFVSTSSSRSSSSSAMHAAVNYKKVFVAGGSKGVGRCVVDQLLQQGSEVVCLIRDPETAAELNSISGVTAVVGDAFDQKTVENIMDGCDAAITTLGGSTDTVTNVKVDYAGNSNVIESAGILGVTRVVLVTSIGCGNSKEAAPPAVFEQLREVLEAKNKAENLLIKYYTNTNWTIIRPAGLKTAPATGKAILTEDNKAIGVIHREDVAALVIKALGSANTERKILSAIDISLDSAMMGEGKVVEEFATA
jgi:nucleoside-diphosphate-sugar epimerase